MPTLRQHALAIFHAGLRAADPFDAVTRHFRLNPSRYEHIYVVGAGKASARMALAVERALGRSLTGGSINVKDGHTARLRRIKIEECGHPIPDQRGVEGSGRIAEIARNAGAGDLVIALISGGASALLPLPAEPVTLAEKQETTRLMLACGATIHDVNAVRKHLSAIKGGRLAEMASPAQVLSLILSDVVGDDLSVIGSGPTAPDPSTFAHALAVLDRVRLRARVPASVLERLERGAAGEIAETPKQLSNVHNRIVGSNRLAIAAGARKARQLGYRTLVLASGIEGEARDVARVHSAILKEHTGCILSGGETTVTIHGDGLGGRNQEFALAAAIDIAGLDGAVILSAGTDGSDGPTDAAGGMVDGGTVERAAAKGLDAGVFLNNNDSYHFLEAAGALLKTGPTGTNVMDLRVMLRGRPRSIASRARR